MQRKIPPSTHHSKLIYRVKWLFKQSKFYQIAMKKKNQDSSITQLSFFSTLDGQVALKGGALNFMSDQQDPLHTIKTQFDL